ncbi:hypothetical protein [Rhizobium tumorigenes]|uniref:hypothetical protein n=1 Tax=Rhizobium tumorigenes TaxID=2041385 RepID=UPI00241C77B0|nr:hypothetical protein [Rhizobium tumorigenes]WFS02750.1 hypothetical protein PR016_09185 [Rhizobium tumorigenes]
MLKSEAEAAIPTLIGKWLLTRPESAKEQPSFSSFKTWLDDNHFSNYLSFKSTAGPMYDVELWFDRELNQLSRR